jgi:hypothetical protein
VPPLVIVAARRGNSSAAMSLRATPHALLVLALLGCAQPEPPQAAAETSGAEPSSAPAPVAIDGTLPPASDPGSAPASVTPQPEPATDTGFVSVNGVALTAPDFAELQAVLGGIPKPGRYWYDAASGLWGLEGHGAGGVTRPGLTAAPLPADASAGASAAFVNGRQLPATELTAIATLLEWPLPADGRYSGHYTLDGDGALNSAKGRYLGNVAAASKRRAAGETPGAVHCIWYHLHEPDEILGQAVTIACD